MLTDEQDLLVDGIDAVDDRSVAVEAGTAQIHFSGDSQASQDSSKILISTILKNASILTSCS